jgi:hypothetical protein
MVMEEIPVLCRTRTEMRGPALLDCHLAREVGRSAGGYRKYVTALLSFVSAHHLTEDEVAFPYFEDRLPEMPFDRLEEEHEEIERMLEQAQGRVEGLDEEPEALRDLEAQLREIRELWHPHIGIEEKHLDAERLGEMLPVEEHERISGEMGKLSMEHAEPLHLVVPFALYNLPADERAALTRNMPPKVIEELMPGPWKERWAPMQPFLLA